MIWFKHFTGYRNDPKVRTLREEFGIDGAAIPIFMVEIVAESLGPANPKPFLTYSRRTWAEFVGVDVRRLNKVLARMQEIDLFEVTVEPDGRITFGSDKILEYCDKYTQDLKRTGKIPAKKYGKKSEQISEQGSATESSSRSRKKGKKEEDLTPSTLGTCGPESPADGETTDEQSTPEERKAILETLKATIENMGTEKPSPKVAELRGSGNDEIPTAEGPEVDEMFNRLGQHGFTSPMVDDVLNAWWAMKNGSRSVYALAEALDKHNVKGKARTEIYNVLEVV